MECQHGIVGQVGVCADAQHGLHELIPAGSWLVVESPQSVSDIRSPTCGCQLRELGGGNLQLGRITCGDVAILICSLSGEPPPVCVNDHLDLLGVSATALLETVELSLRCRGKYT